MLFALFHLVMLPIKIARCVQATRNMNADEDETCAPIEAATRPPSPAFAGSPPVELQREDSDLYQQPSAPPAFHA
jgi:hypothetical protein